MKISYWTVMVIVILFLIAIISQNDAAETCAKNTNLSLETCIHSLK